MPQPTTLRWSPLRAGLVDLFYYDTEEFHFHHGSLLLRGNNGTGKSKVLALTVPFLLDGELAPHRVEPDGDRNKRMEWNLLLGGRYPHSERLGYTWLEFGRRTPDGATHFTTVGCGMKAAAGRGMVRHWFFITTQRVGGELSLVGPTGTALTRERLREAIEGHGLVYDRASDYRRAVDEALFGLGTRYEALVSLLIQLRQPQLSKRPDERLLSNALTQALAPLDENLVAQAAEAFRGLDDEREALLGLRETKKAADDFLTGYRRYARTAARRTAAGPRRTQAAYEQLGRDLGEAERAHAQAERELAEATARLETLTAQHRLLTDQQLALKESPEARAAENLEREARRAEQLTAFAAQQRAARERAGTERRKAGERLERARAALDQASVAVAGYRTEAAGAAAGARIAARHAAEVEPGAVCDPGAADRAAAATTAATPATTAATMADGADIGVETASKRGDDLAAWRERSLRTMDKLLDAHAEAAGRLREARRRLDAVTSELSAADGRIAASQATVEAVGTHLVTDVRRFLATAGELVVSDSDEVSAQLELWVETLDGENPARAAITAAYRRTAEALTRARAAVDAAERTELARRDELSEEIERLSAGGQDAPPAPYTRGPDARTERPGAPLWRVVDFLPEVTPADRAGIEAALEASGVLDAWLCPDGTVLDPATHDVIIRPGQLVSTSLSTALRPAIDPVDPQAGRLGEHTVRGVLDSIGLGDADATVPVWVAADGRYRLGILTGQWSKDSARYIGEGAREAARRARLVDLKDQVEQVDARLEALSTEAGELRQRTENLNIEYDRCPEDTPLRDAHTALRAERTNRERVAEARQDAVRAGEKAAEDEERAASAAREFAADVDLPTERGPLSELERSLGAYRIALVRLWASVSRWRAAWSAVGEAEPELREAKQIEAETAERHAEAEQEAVSASERHRTLADTVGTAVAELERRLADTELRLRGCGKAIEQTRGAQIQATGDRGRAEGHRDRLAGELREAAARRDTAVEAFRAFAGTGLLALACPELELPDPAQPWAATPAVTLARAVDRALETVDDGDRRWELAQQAVTSGFKLLADGLSRHNHQAVMSARDGMLLVDVKFQGRVQPVANLAAALDAEIDQRQRILSAHEREVLETHLVSEVAGTLQELIASAERQVAEMNQELKDRPTSTGMRLRLVWRPAKQAPSGLAELRGRLLRQSSDVWNDADRQRVGAFLSEQIAAERLRDDAGTWHEQLANALDYRAWHEFVIERYADGQWRPASGPASGGERVLAASIPLFAAASSYYRSAGSPYAPRLIALDEAFAGVDDDSRAKCLGLLARFDLDVIMTSEREWGCYPEVPGLAIAQLARRDGIDAVLVTPWRWDGQGSRYQVPRPRMAGAAPIDDGQDLLFT